MDGTLYAAIIDDELLCVDRLRELLLRFDYVQVAWERSSSDGLPDLLRASPVDLLFLDIKIQQENGFAIAEYINRNFPEMMIVFTTGFEGFAVHGYDYEPLDFLTKPVNELRLEKALSRALARRSRLTPCAHTRIGFHTGSGLRIVEVDRILYIEKSGRKVQMLYGDPEKPEIISLRGSLSEAEQIFAPYGFFRIHQAFLVPLRRVCAVLSADSRNSYQVELTGIKGTLPLSRSKYAPLRALLEEGRIRFIQ